MKKRLNIMFTLIGVLLCVGGFILLRTVEISAGIMQVLPYICLGLGCGSLGHGLGGSLEHAILKKDPEMQKKIEIEQKDERNIAVTNRAKGKAYDFMLYLFSALMICFVFMRADLAVILMLVAAYLIVTCVFIFYLNKYQKEM